MSRPLIPALSAAIAALCAIAPAHASTQFHEASAGSACHPANGAAAAKFVRSMHTLTNNNTTEQYVVCDLRLDDVSGQPVRQVYLLRLFFTAGATGGTLWCAAQTGSHYYGTTHVTSSAAKSKALTAGDNGEVYWEAFELSRSSQEHLLGFNCKVPPGFRLGLIELIDMDGA